MHHDAPLRHYEVDRIEDTAAAMSKTKNKLLSIGSMLWGRIMVATTTRTATCMAMLDDDDAMMQHECLAMSSATDASYVKVCKRVAAAPSNTMLADHDPMGEFAINQPFAFSQYPHRLSTSGLK